MITGDEPEQLTAAETVHAMAAIIYVMAYGRPDAIMATALEKLKASAARYAAENPGTLDALTADMEMLRRFRDGE
jgi:hypothetical protein